MTTYRHVPAWRLWWALHAPRRPLLLTCWLIAAAGYLVLALGPHVINRDWVPYIAVATAAMVGIIRSTKFPLRGGK